MRHTTLVHRKLERDEHGHDNRHGWDRFRHDYEDVKHARDGRERQEVLLRVGRGELEGDEAEELK